MLSCEKSKSTACREKEVYSQDKIIKSEFIPNLSGLMWFLSAISFTWRPCSKARKNYVWTCMEMKWNLPEDRLRVRFLLYLNRLPAWEPMVRETTLKSVMLFGNAQALRGYLCSFDDKCHRSRPNNRHKLSGSSNYVRGSFRDLWVKSCSLTLNAERDVKGWKGYITRCTVLLDYCNRITDKLG